MIRAVTGIVLVMVAVPLGGCGSDSGGSGAETSHTGPDAAVAGLGGDKLCDMVDLALLEERFGEPFADALGGVNPPEQDGSVVCTYQSQAFIDAEVADLADKLQVTTTVTFMTEATTAQDALDASLADDGETVAYQPVDGLGAVAGYADNDLNVDSGGSYLVAIIDVDGTFVEIAAKAEPEGTAEQLRPIANELLPKVEAELR